jgi:hypothetical protein
MSFKRRSNSYTGFDLPGGNVAIDTFRSYVDDDVEDTIHDEVAPSGVHWGDYLRPHHFNFTQASPVCARRDGRPDLVCTAVSVLGAGQFKETESSHPVPFTDGAIIVKAGKRVACFTFEEFRQRFRLVDGSEIVSIYQIDFQTPKK